jgi:hypothetical protein
VSETHGFPRGAQDEPAPVAQWVGLLLAPAVFAAHLQVAYILVRWACLRNGDLWVHLVDLLAVLLSAVGTWVAWRVWNRAGGAEPGDEGGSGPRTRLLGVLGMGMSTMITIVLVGQWAAAFFISTCQ